MKRFLFLLTVTLCVALPVRAAEPSPTVEMRLKSISQLLPLVEYVGALAGQEDQAKQMTAVVKAFAGKKGLEGVDIKRPIGLYAQLTPAMIDSPIVLMVPIVDEQAFLGLLTNRLNLKPTKGEDDEIYSVTLPNVAPKAYFCFHKNYVCASLYNREALKADKLLNPKAFLAKEDPAFFSMVTHLDRLPPDVRKNFLGQLELKLADGKKQQEGKSKASQLGYNFSTDVGFEAIRAMLEEGKDLRMGLRVEPTSDELAFDLSMTAKDGTLLQKSLASAGKKKSITASAAAAKNPLFAFSANFQMTELTHKFWNKAIALVLEEALKDAQGEGRDHLSALFDALTPSLKSGEFDLALGLSGDQGEFALNTAVKLVKGEGLEKFLKEISSHIPPEVVQLKTDKAKVGAVNLHTLLASPPEVKSVFGTDQFWVATGKNLLAISSGEKDDGIKKLAAATSEFSDLLRAELSLVRLLTLTEKVLSKEEVAKIQESIFEKTSPAGNDTAIIRVSAGEQLQIRFTVKGKGGAFAAKIQQTKDAKNK